RGRKLSRDGKRELSSLPPGGLPLPDSPRHAERNEVFLPRVAGAGRAFAQILDWLSSQPCYRFAINNAKFRGQGAGKSSFNADLADPRSTTRQAVPVMMSFAAVL